MEIRKAWLISRSDGWMSFYETRDEAVREARALARADRKTISGIYETFAAYDDVAMSYDAVWSDDIPELNSSWGLRGGESVEEEELEDIIKNGRGMD